jgi:L-threonine-O-3-phosphate decarboxylase
MTVKPRGQLACLQDAVHGALDHAELRRLGLKPDDVLDVSANLNPFGPSPAVARAIADCAIDQYPDRETLRLRRCLAELLEVSPARILAGNGASELIWLTALAFLEAGDRVVILEPTFCEYARVSALAGAAVHSIRAVEEHDFRVDAAAVERELERIRPRLVFLANPNNPTGTILPVEELGKWAKRLPETLFVIDEAYLAFTAAAKSALTLERDNVLVIRSMTKDFGLAGLRLGYAVGAENLVCELAKARPPWSVNALAQAAGVAALQDMTHLQQSLALLNAAQVELVQGLQRVGMKVLPSAVHYFLVRVGNGAAVRAALLRERILVRDCASFGLPAFVRISTRRPEENVRLLDAVRRLELAHG